MRFSSWRWRRRGGSGTGVFPESGNNHVVEETAGVCVISFQQGDESLVSPRGSPRVAHDPGAGILTDGYDTVVQIGAAVRKDTATLELPLLSVHCDCHRAIDYSRHERTILTCEHLRASDIAEYDFGRAQLASAVLGCVRLAGLTGCAICLKVDVCVLHEASLAAMVHLVAVD